MGFDEDFAEASQAFFDCQGVAATWNRKSGATVATYVIFVETEVMEVEGNSGNRSEERVALVKFPTADTGDYTGVPDALIDDSVTIDGVTWAVRSISDRHAGMANALIVTKDRLEVSRPNYRGKF